MIVSSTKEEVKTKDTFVDSTDAFLVGPPSNCCKECAREHDPVLFNDDGAGSDDSVKSGLKDHGLDRWKTGP